MIAVPTLLVQRARRTRGHRRRASRRRSGHLGRLDRRPAAGIVRDDHDDARSHGQAPCTISDRLDGVAPVEA